VNTAEEGEENKLSPYKTNSTAANISFVPKGQMCLLGLPLLTKK